MNTLLRNLKGEKREEALKFINRVIGLRKKQIKHAENFLKYYKHKLKQIEDVKKNRLPIDILKVKEND